MRKRRLLCLALAAMLAGGCSFAAPEEAPPQETAPEGSSSAPASEESPSVPDSLSLAYDANDSLNPYRMGSVLNQKLAPLFYDSLVRPDPARTPENQLAESVRMQGKVCIVQPRKDARFSDGSYLSAKDLMYSLMTAQSSALWRPVLRNVESWNMTEDGALEIRLYQADADFPVLLTFPIIKDGTAEMEYPVGIGKFYVAGAHNTGVNLKRSPLYYRQDGQVQSIRLIHAADSSALQFRLKTGEIDLVYADLNDGFSSTLSASGAAVALNNLVFLGINSSKGPLAMPEFRHALSVAINRDELVSTAYVGRARPSIYPMHPDFYRLEGMDTAVPRNLSAAEALLDGLGLSEKDAAGWRLYEDAPITLRLLVNSENSYRNAAATLIADQLVQLGIRVEVVSGSFSQYQSDLAAQRFDLYIGETRLMDNMDFTPLLPGGALAYGTAYSGELEERYDTYRSTGNSIEELCSMFVEIGRAHV